MNAGNDRRIAAHVARRIKALEDGYLPRGSRARATSQASYAMAVLRRADPGEVSTDLTAWGLIFDGFDADLQYDGGVASPYERATHAALSLYARHQRSKSTSMHHPGISLGSAMRALASDPDGTLKTAPLRRFHAVTTATSPTQRMYHLRTLISLLRSEDIPLDYARLAMDLRRIDSKHSQQSVLLQWARDLHRQPATTAPTPSTAQPEEA